jgi:hypothetical protein
MQPEVLLNFSGRLVHEYFLPHWRLRAAYWQIRACRFSACRRRWYRAAARQKKRLLDAGADPEAVRLYCRFLANPSSEDRLVRLGQYLAQGQLDLFDNPFHHPS